MDVYSSVVEHLPSTQEALDSAPELPINKVRTDQVSYMLVIKVTTAFRKQQLWLERWLNG